MKHQMFAALVGLAMMVAHSPARAASCSLAGLSWISGVWRFDNDASQVEERWTIGPNDRLIGSSWQLHPGRAGGVIEAMTIASDGSMIALRLRHFDDTLQHAREARDEPMLFVASDCADNAVVFVGQGSRAGERITYRRNGDRLRFIGDFIHDGKPVRAELTFAASGTNR